MSADVYWITITFQANITQTKQNSSIDKKKRIFICVAVFVLVNTLLSLSWVKCQILSLLDRFGLCHLYCKLVQPCLIKKCKHLNSYEFSKQIGLSNGKITATLVQMLMPTKCSTGTKWLSSDHDYWRFLVKSIRPSLPISWIADIGSFRIHYEVIHSGNHICNSSSCCKWVKGHLFHNLFFTLCSTESFIHQKCTMPSLCMRFEVHANYKVSGKTVCFP